MVGCSTGSNGGVGLLAMLLCLRGGTAVTGSCPALQVVNFGVEVGDALLYNSRHLVDFICRVVEQRPPLRKLRKPLQLVGRRFDLIPDRAGITHELRLSLRHDWPGRLRELLLLLLANLEELCSAVAAIDRGHMASANPGSSNRR